MIFTWEINQDMLSLTTYCPANDAATSLRQLQTIEIQITNIDRIVNFSNPPEMLGFWI